MSRRFRILGLAVVTILWAGAVALMTRIFDPFLAGFVAGYLAAALMLAFFEVWQSEDKEN